MCEFSKISAAEFSVTALDVHRHIYCEDALSLVINLINLMNF